MGSQEVVQQLRHLGADPSDIPDMLFDLSIQAYEVYKDSLRLKDITAAVDFVRGSILHDCHDSPVLPERLHRLAFLLTTRYNRSNETENIDEAVNIARQAVNLTPHGHPDQPYRITELGNGLAARFRGIGEMADLVEAVKLARQAVELTPIDHMDRASWLNNLGNRLAELYEASGDMANLEEAIETVGESVKRTLTDHPNMAGRINNLANCLSVRYRTVHEAADLEEAVRAARNALELLPANFPNRGIWLNNLSVSLMNVFERKNNMEDLENAIQAAREAVESTAPDDSSFAVSLTSLGNALKGSYKCTQNVMNLEEATQLARQAIELTPKDHPYYPDRLGSLGLCFASKYELTNDTADLERAISFTKAAVILIPLQHPGRTRLLNNLAGCLQDRYLSRHIVADLEEASTCLEEAWNCQSGIPLQRIHAAVGCLRLFFKLGKIESAAELGKAAIELLPVINTGTLNLNDRQFIIKNFYSIGSDVCSSLLSLHQPIDALQYLERGRALVMSNLIDKRGDLSTLREEHFDLVARYEKLRDELYTPFESNINPRHLQQHRGRQHFLTEFKGCIQEIRKLPGFERFLLGQTVSEMQECASGGTIIIVNVNALRSDAILVFPLCVKTLNLPKLLFSEAVTWLETKWTCRWHQFEDKNEEYCKFLSWLWDVCVDPILRELSTKATTDNNLPRVWWIGTGLASTMPFHAAGSHSINCTENTLSRVVSSYIPSIKALGYARERATSTKRTKGSMLIVTMPTTPSQPTQTGNSARGNLPGVLKEKKEIQKVVPASLQVETLDTPTVHEVILKLKDCYIAHFACHGSADPADPANSGLILQQLTVDQPEQDRLTVYKISELNLAHGHIAYLSACSTAENRNVRLWDEMLHIVSGFQMAGYPHVVGCLLKTNDDICVQVARSFYQSLFQLQNGMMEDNEPARALHNAILLVRSKYNSRPLLWAQFIHVGA